MKSHIDARAQTRRKIEIALRDATQSDVLRPHCQPLNDLSSGRIAAFEALVRRPHPERGMISPGKCVLVVEESGLIDGLGGMILRRSCMDAKSSPNRASCRGEPLAGAVPQRQSALDVAAGLDADDLLAVRLAVTTVVRRAETSSP